MGAVSAVIVAPWQTWSELTAIYAVNSLHVGRWTAGLRIWHEGSTESLHGGSF